MADSVMPARPRSSRRGAAARLRSAVSTVVRSVTVAAGVFAPGHLGELTRQVPFELVDAVLEQTRATERRLRTLPSRVGVYFVLALAVFPGVGAAKVWASMLAGLDVGLRVSVSGKALRDLRRRVGAAPVKALFETLAGPVAQPTTPGVRFGRYRTVAFDGCVSIKVPDTDRNRAWLGKLRAALGVTGYPAPGWRVRTTPRPIQRRLRTGLGCGDGPVSCDQLLRVLCSRPRLQPPPHGRKARPRHRVAAQPSCPRIRGQPGARHAFPAAMGSVLHRLHDHRRALPIPRPPL